jgi:hypothetical protein
MDVIALDGRGLTLFPQPAVPAMGTLMRVLLMDTISTHVSRLVSRRAQQRNQREASCDISQLSCTHCEHEQVLQYRAHHPW